MLPSAEKAVVWPPGSQEKGEPALLDLREKGAGVQNPGS